MLLLTLLIYFVVFIISEYIISLFVPGLGTMTLIIKIPILFLLSYVFSYLFVYFVSIHLPLQINRIKNTLEISGVRWLSFITFVVSIAGLLYVIIDFSFTNTGSIAILFPMAFVSLLNSLGIEVSNKRLLRPTDFAPDYKPFLVPDFPEQGKSPEISDPLAQNDIPEEKAPSTVDVDTIDDNEVINTSSDSDLVEETESDSKTDDATDSPEASQFPENIDIEQSDLMGDDDTDVTVQDDEEMNESSPDLIQPEIPPIEQDQDKSTHTYHWEFKGKPYKLSLNISKSTYDKLKSEARCLDVSEWGKVYVTNGITNEVREIVVKLLQIQKNYGTYQEVSFVLSFVQGVIRYQQDIGEYPKYPIETLTEGTGDCEDYSILGAAILKCMDYDVALLVMPKHVALGIAGASDLPGSYILHNGVRYYYSEMTSQGWRIGDIPDGEKHNTYEVFPIEKPPPKVVIPDECR